MWALLFLLTAAVVLLPMLPAILEWRFPSDVVPLHIDSQDALDPPFLARSFKVRLDEAVAQGQLRLGKSHLAETPTTGAWRFIERERRSHASRRVWQSAGDITLPAEMTYLGEVAAQGSLRTAPNEVYRGLWAGERLNLANCATLLRWAHGRTVDVHSGCQLAGRVSADERITLWGPATFLLLHAPVVCFNTDPVRAQMTSSRPLPVLQAGLPEPVVWNDIAQRGTCDEPLEILGGTAWQGDLVCRADLVMGPRCTTDGSLKVHGDLEAGAGCQLTGNAVVEGRIELGPNCIVGGSLLSETEIVLGAGCVVGAPGRLATVAAPRVRVAPGVVVHGTIWASDIGRTQGYGVADELPRRRLAGAAGRPDLGFEEWAETEINPRPGQRPSRQYKAAA